MESWPRGGRLLAVAWAHPGSLTLLSWLHTSRLRVGACVLGCAGDTDPGHWPHSSLEASLPSCLRASWSEPSASIGWWVPCSCMWGHSPEHQTRGLAEQVVASWLDGT